MAIKAEVEFDLSRQQDAAEILELMLEEFSIDAPFAGGLFDISVSFSRQCDLCHELAVSDDRNIILKIPVTTDIATSFDSFFLPSSVEKMCFTCGRNTLFTETKSFLTSGSHLIIQLMRFTRTLDGIATKNSADFAFSKFLSIPITSHDGGVTVKEFRLKGFINHLGTLENGHYTATVHRQQWLHCDDMKVSSTNCGENFLSKYVYLMFYEQVQ